MLLSSYIDKFYIKWNTIVLAFIECACKLSHIKWTNYFELQPSTAIDLKTLVLTSKTTSFQVSCSTLSLVVCRVDLTAGCCTFTFESDRAVVGYWLEYVHTILVIIILVNHFRIYRSLSISLARVRPVWSKVFLSMPGSPDNNNSCETLRKSLFYNLHDHITTQ